MMRCETVKQFVDALRDGSLNRPETEKVRAHLAACAACAREWTVTEALRAAIRSQASVPAAPADFREAMARRLEAQGARQGWFARLQTAFRHQPVAAMAFGAAMVLLVLAPLNLWVLSRQEIVAPLIEESVNEHIRLGLRGTALEIPGTELRPLLTRHQKRLEFFNPLSLPDDQEHQLIGGQVSYLLHRKVLAVTYSHRPKPHITLLVIPSSGIQLPKQLIGHIGKVYGTIHRGFYAVEWLDGPFIYTLVTDSVEEDLTPLIEKLRRK